MPILLPLIAGSALVSAPSIVTRTVEYKDASGAVLEGFVAYEEGNWRKRPLVLIVHDWDGLGEYEQKRARQLAEMGFVGFAVDIYGKGERPTGAARGGTAGKYRGNIPLFRERLKAGFDAGVAMTKVDAKRVGAIGYCFGGGGVLEMGRSRLPIKALIPIHGSLTPKPDEDKNIRGRTLVLHGAADPGVPPAQVAAFEASMKRNRKPYRIVAYPGAVHAFTVPEAGNDPSRGSAYDADADRKSFIEMRNFLRAQLGR